MHPLVWRAQQMRLRARGSINVRRDTAWTRSASVYLLWKGRIHPLQRSGREHAARPDEMGYQRITASMRLRLILAGPSVEGGRARPPQHWLDDAIAVGGAPATYGGIEEPENLAHFGQQSDILGNRSVRRIALDRQPGHRTEPVTRAAGERAQIRTSRSPSRDTRAAARWAKVSTEREVSVLSARWNRRVAQGCGGAPFMRL